MDNSKQLNLLLIKLENLLLRQQDFEAEIIALKKEVRQLQFPNERPDVTVPTPRPEPQTVNFPQKNRPPVYSNQNIPAPQPQQRFPRASNTGSFSDNFKKENIVKSDFEKFIGENLISKIGILILIIGVAIGAKYAIDHDMISPLTRIILGYGVGVGLMAFAIKLKEKYENFSAVLVSGAIAIMYFITYAAYDFYALIPQALAFILMVVFTSFTVVAAIKYNKQIIAHIGLVGAYAVPFLLSDGSGKVVVLFSYMAIINIGILILSFKKYWKPLFYVSFGLSWLIFGSWLMNSFDVVQHYTIALVFSTLFFIIFYITNLAYKVSKKEQFGFMDIVLILLNSFVYYGLGYYILQTEKTGVQLLGLFTLFNAVIHFVVSLIIYKKQLADKNLFYLILAMVITFITMAVPVQLNGGWVTIFWAVEAAVLFYLGRVKNISIYEKLSFPLIFLAFLSLLQDWSVGYNYSYYDYNNQYKAITPILNVGFLTASIFIAAFGWMFSVNKKENENPERWLWAKQVLTYVIPSILLLVTYITFKMEIEKYFNNLYHATKININPKAKLNYDSFRYNYNIMDLKVAWIYVYTLIFATALTWLNLKKIKNTALSITVIAINLLVVILFLTHGLWNLSLLRDTFKTQSDSYFTIPIINIVIRYISIAFFALLITACYYLSNLDTLKRNLKTAFDYLLYISLLWVISSELINILELSKINGGHKLGLSILWGVYSLFLISIGLWKNKKHLRIGAIVLFGITLIKLFVYDISYMDTIAKTIVFVSLGVLLLIISFLYNKYKHLIIDDVKTEN
ncbi:DUF2339 domain-containing protein [Pedobacter punctiformis]|uniref:DUF2339 domain-containing protein n=1 Tax=Pedobacter punctiformis TaxID=3004097 RepID=A0ABT4L986_9SPHI|nr:DUF2339 domain-containing protein [Pedobacter sp. HCMS5-2]MCZ4244482.1 DUF2339 domain-containing protein [Pedobacter sp. HCMS5-2]